ncbi:hypothetical protein HW452_05215 [Halomonas aquamarina]|uniref:Uncharacterized protein n=1 Tax=Vreelandella aquamarina TaxID=77097 RepID=A0ACC5VT40_9GAMM|nr:hypothetical protein [Halomonas aquamarina]MBZ5486921.1 hypothetical protein [Halomonas aquamarina]
MAELLAQIWLWALAPFQDPRIAAAVPAFLVSWLIGNRNTALVCAVIAFCTIKLIIWLSGIPAGGAYQLPVEAAAGVGAGMALMGVHGIQDRVQGLKFKTLLSSIADSIRGKR